MVAVTVVFPNAGRYSNTNVTLDYCGSQGEQPKELEEVVYTDPLELYCDDNPEADECRWVPNHLHQTDHSLTSRCSPMMSHNAAIQIIIFLCRERTVFVHGVL